MGKFNFNTTDIGGRNGRKDREYYRIKEHQ